MKQLLCLIFMGLFALLNAQGITNTLGGNSATDKFIVENSASEAGLVITGEGNVGIGTTNPLSKLSVGGNGNSDFAIYGEVSSSSGHGVHGSATGSGGLGVYGIALNSSGVNYGGYFTAYGSSGQGVHGFATGSTGSGVFGTANGSSGRGVTGYATGSGGIGVFASATTGYGIWAEATYPSGVNYGGHFSTASSSGRAIRGHATNTSGENYGGAFRAAGDNSRAVWAHGQAYDYYAAGPGTNYGAASSIRWKNNIVEIDNPLEKIAELRGVYFDWDEEHGGRHDVGCIAEEVGKVLPEIVVYEKNSIDASGMDYSKLTPLLVEAVNAQQELIVELTERINALESR